VNARDEILARTRLGLTAPDLPAEPAGSGYASEGEMVERFIDRLVDYKARVSRCTADELPTAVAAALDGVARLVVPADLPAAWLSGFPGEVLRAGEIVRKDDVSRTDENGRTDEVTPTGTDVRVNGIDAGALDRFDGVVTGCAVAIAETGTIVLDAGAFQGPRALSLIPDRHVCVVRVDQVQPDVPDAVALLTPTRPLTWISGPSATSDIELNRVEGVHGPRHLHVLVVSP
jgi:L-lactate dehydrogenase complex protein LldG